MQPEGALHSDIILCAAAGTLPGLFALRVQRTAEAPAYRQFDAASGAWWTHAWQETGAPVERWRRALARENLAPGERVAILLHNSVEWVCFDLARIFQICLGARRVSDPGAVECRKRHHDPHLPHRRGNRVRWRTFVGGRKRGGRHSLALRVFVVFCLAALSGCSPPRAYESAMALADTVAGEAPSRFKAKTPAPRRTPVVYRADGRQRASDLYLPGEGKPRAGLVLVPGVVPQSRNDPRIVAFALTLARAGFAVLVPDMAGFRDLRINPRDAREVADAFAYLVSRPELAPAGRAGMAAFSYAVGPAVLAALEPDILERVRFIVGVGGYHDLGRAMRFFTTGWFEHEGRWQAIAPDEYGQLVLVRSAMPYLASARDRALLEAMVERRTNDRAARLDDLAARLGDEGRAVYDLVTNRDRDRFPALFEALPADMKRDFSTLDLAGKDLTRLRARLILVHGRNDNLIPYPETLALTDAVGREQTRVFLIHRILGHVDLSLGHILSWPFWSEELPDAWRMGRATYLLLAERADE